jgi:hypothetical protein
LPEAAAHLFKHRLIQDEICWFDSYNLSNPKSKTFITAVVKAFYNGMLNDDKAANR